MTGPWKEIPSDFPGKAYQGIIMEGANIDDLVDYNYVPLKVRREVEDQLDQLEPPCQVNYKQDDEGYTGYFITRVP